jgi:uncharacterized protein
MTTHSVIDADVHPAVASERVLHFLEEPWRSRYAGGDDGPGDAGYRNPHGYKRTDAVLPDGTRIESRPDALARGFFDVYGVEFGILNPDGPPRIGLSPERDYPAALLSAVNDVFVEDWLPVDERFRLSLCVPLSDPHLAAAEIRRLGGHPQVVQVLLPSAAPMPYGHRFFHPIYKAAAEQNLIIGLHPGYEGSGVAGAPSAVGYPSSYLEWHTGLVGTYIAQLVSLVVEGVFNQFPTLKVVLIEGGVCWLPPLMWRLDKNWKGLRATAPWLKRPPSEIVSEHILLTTQPLEEPPESKQFTAMLDMFDAGRMLMFSTDFPHWDGDTPEFVARSFPRELRSRVLRETAREVYGLGRGRDA